MNFYKRYSADYQRKTARLTLAQHGAYTLLLDEYYATEAPLPPDLDALYRICRAMNRAEQEAVRMVADQFFPVDEQGQRRNLRADEEIEEAAPAMQAARKNGLKGGRPKKPKENPLGFQNKTQEEPATNPARKLLIAHSSEKKELRDSEANASGAESAKPGRGSPPEEIIFGYGVPLLVSAGSEEKHARSFLGKLRKDHGDTRVIDALRECVRAKPLQPLEWLAGALPPKGKAAMNRQESIEADGKRVAAEWLAEQRDSA